MTALVYKFGVRAHWDFPPEALNQLRLANRFYNKLVELHHDHSDRVAAIWSTRPEVAGLEAALKDAEERLEKARLEVGRSKQANRGTASNDAKKTLTKARKHRKALKVDYRQAKDAAYAALKPQFEESGAAEKAAAKAARQDFAAKGLYWGTYNAVAQDFRTAVVLVNRRRKQGLPADLRFKRFAGEGTLTVQLQRQAGDPPRCPSLLASGDGKWQKVFRLEPWVDPGVFGEFPRSVRRSVGAGHAHLAIGGGYMLKVPVRVHRMIPPDADVAMVQLTRRRVGSKYRMTLAVTAKLPDPPLPDPTLPVVAVHSSWAATGVGVRVATIASSCPLAPFLDRQPDTPSDRKVTVRLSADRTRATVTAPNVLTQMGRLEAVQSQIDTSFDRAIKLAQDLVDEHPELAWPNGEPFPTRALLGRWRSPRRLASLVWHVRTNYPGVDVAALEEWRVQNKHLSEWVAHERDQLAGRVRDAWRNVAAWLVGQASQVIVDGTAIADLRRNQMIDEDRDLAHEQGARNVQVAAPGAFREQVTVTASVRGVPVSRVDPSTGYTVNHFGCGGTGQDEGVVRRLRCDACGVEYDVEVNAIANLLASTEVP